MKKLAFLLVLIGLCVWPVGLSTLAERASSDTLLVTASGHPGNLGLRLIKIA